MLQGANINARDRVGSTPIFYAAAANNVKSCAQLLNSGCIVNTRDDFDGTPLSIALRNGNYQVAKMMLLFQADIHFKLTKSQTLLHVACDEGNLKKVSQCQVDSLTF